MMIRACLRVFNLKTIVRPSIHMRQVLFSQPIQYSFAKISKKEQQNKDKKKEKDKVKE